MRTDEEWPTPRAILFDLDDTILDDSSNVDSAWRTACTEAAAEVSGLDVDELLAAIDRARGWYWSDPERHREGRMDLRAATRGIVRQALVSLGFDLPALARTIGDGYRDLREAGIHPFPDAVESLERLRAVGVRLGLITNGNGQSQRAKIDRFDLARHFEYVLVEGEFGVGKPDERVYLTVMEALRSRPEETWSVGDNLEWDVAAPQRLGVRGVWVDHRRAGLPSGAPAQPDRIIYSIAELP